MGIRRVLRAGAVALVLAAGTTAGTAAPAGPAPASTADRRLVVPELVSAAAEVAPGAPLELALRFSIAPGWHIYWVNPGDSGLPTTVRFVAADGKPLEGAEVQWPVPIRFMQPGDVPGFGWEGTAVALATVPVPASASGRFAVKAHVTWLACEKTCVPGRATLEATLPVGRAQASSEAELFAGWRSAMPLAAGAAGVPFVVARRELRPGRNELVLEWPAGAPRGVEWFPGLDDAIELEPATLRQEARRTVVSVHARVLSGQVPSKGELQSLVAWTDVEGRRRGAWLPLRFR